MTPPMVLLSVEHSEDDVESHEELTSFRVYGVNTLRLLKIIEEEGIDVWLDEYSPPNKHTH